MYLVSACLVGFRCRYDAKIVMDQDLIALVRAGKAIPVCPEQLGGLSCPRKPCEQIGNGMVIDCDGADHTEAFTKGAIETLRIAKLYGCEHAVLKARSPSCGKGSIYDGTFSNVLVNGNGITTELLEQNGITVEVRE